MEIQQFTRTFKDFLVNKLDSPRKSSKHNITSDQKNLIKKLKDNHSIVVKKADKGAAVVLLKTSDYLREIYRQLNDTKFYQKLNKDITPEVSKRLQTVLDNLLKKKLITFDMYEYMNISEYKACKFYMLPKIHKKDIPGRPICSSIGHPTNRISSFIDFHIQKYVPQTASYLRDTQHFIKRVLEIEPLQKGHLIASMDVVSLYTNIPNHEGILAVADWFRQDHSMDHIAGPLLELLRLILHNTNFCVNDEHYLQVGGTSMGTPCAPSFANLFLDKFETKALKNSSY